MGIASLSTRTAPDGDGEKDLSLQTLRGLAIIFVVIEHAVLALGIDQGSSYNYFNYSFIYFRMPLFAAISGFVYSLRPVRAGRVTSFLIGKARRILLPFLTVGTARCVTHQLNHGTGPAELPRIILESLFFTRDDEFWYLQATALCFLAVAFVDRFRFMVSPGRWLVTLAVAIAFHLACPQSRILCFDGFLYLIPFFIFGCGLPRFPGSIFRPPLLTVAWVVLTVGLVNQQFRWWALGDRSFFAYGVFQMFPLAIGLSGILLLFRHRRPVPILMNLGEYAYSIYLFHTFVFNFVHISFGVLFPARSGMLAAQFLSNVVLGLSAPLVIENCLARHRVTRLLFLGLGPKNRKSPRTEGAKPVNVQIHTSV